MKKIDNLILRSFAGPFIATLLISIFVLVMQFFWLYIDDLVGKGLDFKIIMQLIGYVAVFVTPLALPLSLLLSSIMTFGNLGETSELIALKASGISLLRFMRPLFILTLFLSGGAFFLSNNVIPVVNLKLDRLKYDIIKSKPAFDIKAGVFYDKIDGYVIKIGRKDADNKTIHDVVIFEKNFRIEDNLLVAKKGTMDVSPQSSNLVFELLDGWRYEETGNSGENDKTQFVRTGFSSYKKVFDISSFKMNKTDEEGFKYAPRMLTIRQLNPTIDSLSKSGKEFANQSIRTMESQFKFVKYRHQTWTDTTEKLLGKNYLSTFGDFEKKAHYANIVAELNTMRENRTFIQDGYHQKQASLREHKIEWHKKFTLSVACIILFIIGAPLGSIIRKGGIGLPLVFAIIFFTIFYIFNMIGDKIANQGVVPVYQGMWLSSAILLPIGIFLTYKAINDSQLFNKEVYHRLFNTVKIIAQRLKEKLPQLIKK